MNKAQNRNLFGELLTYEQTAERSNLGKGAVMKLARESKSLVKIGRSARVNWPVFYNYLIETYTE